MPTITALLSTLCGSASATEGYFRHGYGAVSQGLAGSDVARARGPLAIARNPAGLAFSDRSAAFALSVFSPRRGIEVEGGPGLLPEGETDSDRNFFYIPDAGVVLPLNDRWTFGFAMFANGGMNTTYPDVPRDVAECGGGDGLFCGGTAGVDLSQAFFAAALSYRFADGWSIGVSPIFAVQAFEAYGIAAFGGLSRDPSEVSDNGFDFSFGGGARIGIEGRVLPWLTVGASYQTRLRMSPFESYGGLFEDGGDFDIPATVVLGVAADVTPDLTIHGSVQRIFYSDIGAVGNGSQSTSQLGDEGGPGFGWDSINVFAIGVQYSATPDLTLRAGYAFSENPVETDQVLFNVLAPGIVQHHFTIGMSWTFGDNWTLDGAALFVPNNTVSGENPFSPGQTIELEMRQFEFTVGLSRRF